MSIMHVNGLMFETDKRGMTMVGDVVVFGDGSIYNTRTGAFNNAGPGYVRVNGRLLGNTEGEDVETSSSAAFTREESFVARPTLALRIISADVSVVNNEGDKMLVEITGPEVLVNAIKLESDDEALHVSEYSPRGDNGSIIISNNSVVTSSFNGISLNGTHLGHGGSVIMVGGIPLSIKVSVPYHTAVTVTTRSGDIAIEGVDGPLIAQITGSANVTASGASGKVSAQVTGSGEVQIDSGEVEHLNAEVTGSGDVRFGGTAQYATLHVVGSGDIRVERVINPPTRQVIGSGDIRVHNVGRYR